MSHHRRQLPQVAAPVPLRKGASTQKSQPRVSSPLAHNAHAATSSDLSTAAGTMPPSVTTSMRQRRRPSYGTIESSREQHYNLDFPADEAVLARLQLDPKSRFFARARPRLLDLPGLLPYATEAPSDRAKFLAHIVAHLYIAVKSLDVQGLLSITAKDLASLKDVAGLSDIDLALETNLFEMNPALGKSATDDEESALYFSQEDLDVDDEDDEDEFEGDLELDADDEESRMDTAHDDYELGESTTQHKKLPKSAAVVGVRIWTHELLVWLKMKYDMPLLLRMALARVYFAICYCRGQHLNLKIYVKAFELLTRDTDLLAAHGFELPWEPVYNEVAMHFPSTDSFFEPLEKKDMDLLLRVGERASCFFEPGLLPVLFRKLASRYSIPNAAVVLWLMRILPATFVPGFGTGESDDSLDSRYYLPLIFYMGLKLSKSAGVDSHLTSIVGRIAMLFLSDLSKNPSQASTFGDFGIFTQKQFLGWMNSLLNSLSINCKKFGSLKTKFFHGYSCAIIFSFNGERPLKPDGIMDQIDILLNAIESYVHPSNTGEWTRPIAKIILSLVYQFHKRYNMEREEHGTLVNLPQEHKISDAVVKRFVKSLLPIVRTGLQSKRASAVDQYLIALGFLAHLDADLTLEFVLLDIYESLEGVISTHRVVTALRCMEELVRYFAATPFYRVHLTRILSMALPGIDSNDLLKTLHTLNVFAGLANFVPIQDLTEGNGDTALAMEVTSMQMEYLQMKKYHQEVPEEFMVDQDTEVEALKSSTTAFKLLIKNFGERVFSLLENIPDPAKSTGLEKDLCDALPKLIYSMIEAMSDDIFKAFRAEVVKFIMDNTIYPVAEVFAEIIGGLIKRDPEYFKQFAPLLIDRIKTEVIENGAGQSRTGVDIVPRDRNLYWNLLILNEAIGNAGSYIVDLDHELNDISFFLMDNVKGPTVMASTYLLNEMLQGVTKIRLHESRLISPAYLKNKKVDETCWGGFQFDKYRFSTENLTFDWFIPGEREIEFAVATFKLHTSKALSNILRLLKSIVSNKANDDRISLDLSDELRVNFLYLAYGISGISYLFDPSFDEDIPKLSEHKFESIQQRLMLLAQIRDLKSAKFSEKDESRFENIYENLEEIVKDIEGDESIALKDFAAENGVESEVLNEYFSVDNASNDSLDENDEKHENKDRRDTLALRKSESPTIEPSARASPQLAGVDMSSMNPAITFRERKLYTSKYYFGDDIDGRRENELYLQIHKTRHLVGQSLHFICKFMQTHLSDNTKLFKHMLYTLNVWFADVGRERILDPSHARISFGYLNELQQINRIRKPFTRIAFGSRLESYHLLRVALHATSRTMTDLDKVLIEDIVKLSCSSYEDIADSAQATLMDAMKRVNGSYNIIIRSALRYLNKALQENNHKNIESGLSIFELKRIKSKFQNDFINLQKYIELLHRCLALDNEEINETAQHLYKSLCGTVLPPRSICLIDHKLVDSIRPPDEFIDLEIKAVMYAKEKKRKIYAEKLEGIENTVVTHEKANTHWRTSSLNLSFLIDLQVDYDIPTNHNAFELLTEAASSDHPVLSKMALKGLSRMFNKLHMLSVLEYNLEKAYDPLRMLDYFKIVDTRPHAGESYYSSWRKELRSEHPTYYVDHKNNNGWLFWDDDMAVVANEPLKLLQLREKDEAIVKSFSNRVTKEWFLNIVRLWIADNDSNFAFHGTDVFVTVSIVILVSNGFVQGMTFKDILDIISEVYEKDEKSAHIVVCELILGILIASKNFNPEFIDERDEFLTGFLKSIFEHDLTPETKNIWTIFAWWIPSHVDTRRFPKVRDVLLDFKFNDDSDSALMEATMLSYIRSLVAAITWATPYPEKILDLCFDNISNRYEAVREQIGSLIAVTSFTFYGDSFGDSEEFIDASRNGHQELWSRNNDNYIFKKLPGLFALIEDSRKQVEILLAQEILKSRYIYTATTVLCWLNQALNTSTSIQYQGVVDTHIVPFLLNLLAMKEVCLLGNIDPVTVFKKVAQIPYDDACLERIVAMLEKYSKQNLNLLQYLVLGEFTETIFFKCLFRLSDAQRMRILNLTNSMMYSKNVEIREALATTFSGLIHTSPPSHVESIVNSFKTSYSKDLDTIRKKYRKVGFKNMEPSDSIRLHGATLGLGALVHAFSFISPPPPWIPQILTILSNKASGIPGIVGKSAKETLGKFKKTRQDSWHIDSKVFSEEQMQDLEGVLWKSYFI